MIIVTGAAGFIGSCMVGKLNNKGYKDILLVDDFSQTHKNLNYIHKSYKATLERDLFIHWLEHNHKDVEVIFHLGARTDTTEFNQVILNKLNFDYSKSVWECCTRYQIPLIYASSAATYGNGALGYDDRDPSLSFQLEPLNPYGISKNEFDKWVLHQEQSPPNWFGLKFFNVFGPNEYHKGRMASVVFHAFNQVRNQPAAKTSVRLFKSHRPDYNDGEQLRDFIYVKDVTDVLFFLMFQKEHSGIYNLGTGNARTFIDLTKAVFNALHLPVSIEFIDTPEDIRDKYQYFTEAKMEKLRSIGYSRLFYSLETAVEEYIHGYLLDGNRF